MVEKNNNHYFDKARNRLKKQLEHVYWIAGGSGAGKSTVAHILAEKHNFHLYKTDETMSEHANRIDLKDCPFTYSKNKRDIQSISFDI